MTQPPGISLTGTHTIGDAALFSADITLPSAQWTCLLGPSGVGKSTVLRLILGLETGGVFSGEIAASDGSPLSGRISYMAQSDLLLPWLTVLDNAVIGARLRGHAPDLDRAKALLDRVGLAAHADKKPAALSGGMRQRAALVRTLMEDRPIVFLDEPFSALDAATRADMQELAADVLDNKTVLLVTHDPAEAARLAHQILVLSDAGVTRWDTPETAIPRDIQAAETVACQMRLLAHVRAAAA